MSASSIVKLRSGETVAVRTGVLRGAGPQGPMGPPGPAGPPGSPGPKGDTGSINDTTSHLRSTASTPVSSAGFVDLPLEEQVDISLLDALTTYSFSVKESGNYAIFVRGDFLMNGVSANGMRALRVIDAGNTSIIEATVQAAANATTTLRMSGIYQLDASQTYKLQGMSNDSSGGIACTTRSLKLARIGSGPAGPAGPQGPVGQTGPTGLQGPAGNAAAGFTSFNAVKGAGADTTTDGGNNAVTADQAITLPSGTSAPHVPYYFNQLATWAEKRVIARFASNADRDTRRPTRAQGEVYTTLDNGRFYVREKDGSEKYLARVYYAATAPPAGTGQAAPGVIWIQV